MPRASGATLRTTIGSSAGISRSSASRPDSADARAGCAARRAEPEQAARLRDRASRRRSARGAHDEARLDADRLARAPRRVLDPREQQLGRDARALGRAEVDRRQRRPGARPRGRCCPCRRPRRRAARRDLRVAQRARARRARAGRWRRRSRPAARARAAARRPRGPRSTMKSSATSRRARRRARARTRAARRGSRAGAPCPAPCAAGPLTNAIRRRPAACRWRTASAAPRREFARTVSTCAPFGGLPITITGAAAPRASRVRCREVAASRGSARRRSAACRSRRIAELVLRRRRSVECSISRPPCARATCLDRRRPSSCRPGSRRPASRTRSGRCAASAATRAAAFGT